MTFPDQAARLEALDILEHCLADTESELPGSGAVICTVVLCDEDVLIAFATGNWGLVGNRWPEDGAVCVVWVNTLCKNMSKAKRWSVCTSSDVHYNRRWWCW